MLKTTGNKNLNGHRVNGRLLAAAFAVAAGFDAQASIISPVVKAGERVVARVLPHATAPAVRGGTKLAAVTAERAAQLLPLPMALCRLATSWRLWRQRVALRGRVTTCGKRRRCFPAS